MTIKIKEFMKRHKSLTLGVFSFVVVFLIIMIADTLEYPWDSEGYYILSQSFVQDGKFSIMNYPAVLEYLDGRPNIRGIIFPLILCPFNQIAGIFLGSEFLGWRLLVSLFSAIFTVTFPLLFKKIGKAHLIPIPLIFLLVTWWGLIFFPLSDLIAVYLLIFALACINKAYLRIWEKGGEPFRFIEIFLFFLSGVLLYAAYNTRTIYLFPIPVVLLIVFLNRKIGIKKSLLITLFICIGIFSLGSVQGISNQNLHGKFSLLVNTKNYSDYDSLFLFQFHQGMRLNLFEAYIGDKPATYRYIDPVGSKIIQTEDAITYQDYFKTVVKYPVETLGLYTRHFLVLMNPISGGAYVYSRNNSRFILSLLNYTLLFFIINFMIRKLYRKNDHDPNIKMRISAFSPMQKTNLISLLILLVPFVAIIPGAIEERFAVPFWLIVYGLFSYVIDFKQEARIYRRNLAFSIVSWCIGFACFMAVLTSVYANNLREELLPILSITQYFSTK